jgi:hypothetical protein
VTEEEQARDWVRFLKAQFLPSYQLEVLLNLDEKMRVKVLTLLGMSTANDVFEKLPERVR